ncbi:MAG: NADH:ubiquinone oxidoreductase subunit J [Rhodanobacter sp. 68-29]|uniref:NADH-quinone oxidoreductase subunit J n=1 Tax=Rhodanobacter sp. PCA2 TaxID=2006117 RepID=UPI00086D9538|nr:NADH-quinone oxidoreductase subunit J [Rhodanobacter sp. PCA2]MBA2078725.1 NADH:ubiquinone oxidoreductase subunit J [Rhodanobacter sp. PCA2]MBN8921707.1 NADH-quinone oxidoreductase subunit J [Rhodanobacter sp.]ODU72577.1 MAG: NADH:ubiquinone oxidoreductase subunit J [Rhodanobacter sp. SCN 69-32]OJY61301.1 MAG: NADH:ubiquinone oxidoreductase subunit J [Rhodanobacter sp. 68-29]
MIDPNLFQLVCFYAFGAVAVLSALAVISLRNSVHAVLALVLTFFSTACIWMLAEAEFLAIALIVVYVGAVMVLFLFVVMMLDIDQEKIREGFVKFLPVGVVVAVVMLVEMLALIGVRAMHAQTLGANPAGDSNTAWLGKALYTQYLLPFEIAALILTVGVIAAVALTLRERRGVKRQQPSEQVAINPRDRVRLVKMAAERPDDAEPAALPAQEAKP